VSRDDHLVRIDGGGFDADEFDLHPERYRSVFASEVISHNKSVGKPDLIHYLIVIIHDREFYQHNILSVLLLI